MANYDNANDVLSELIRHGIVKEQDVQKAAMEVLSDKYKANIDTVHLLFCQGHESVGLTECSYHNEGNSVEMWKQPSHKHWTEFTKKLSNTCDIETQSELAEQLSCLTKVIRAYADQMDCARLFRRWMDYITKEGKE